MKLELHTYSDASDRLSMVKIDRTAPRSYENCLACCIRCASLIGLYASPLDCYEAYIAKQLPKIEKQRLIYHETCGEIERLVRQLCLEGGFAPDSVLPVDNRYQYMPPARAQMVAMKLYDILRARQCGKRPKFKGYHAATKRRLLEAQNHRCCYCGYGLNVFASWRPDFATWEHVVERREGGTDKLDNLVIACRLCNNIREQLRLDAYQYMDWVLANRSELDKRRKNWLRNANPMNRRRKSKFIRLHESPTTRLPYLYG